ncbi:hypothetical protein Tco_0527120 [Tanacetum coccineum]
MNSPPNHEWEQSLDINASDLRLTPFLLDNGDEKPIRIIPGRASIMQATKLRKIVDIQETREECATSTHEYIRKVVEDVGEYEDFTPGSWVSAVEYLNAEGGTASGSLGDIKKLARMRNLTWFLQ